MVSTSTILTMLVIGFSSAIGEKIFGAVGKMEYANLLGLAGLAGLGATAVALVGNLIASLAKMASSTN